MGGGGGLHIIEKKKEPGVQLCISTVAMDCLKHKQSLWCPTVEKCEIKTLVWKIPLTQ